MPSGQVPPMKGTLSSIGGFGTPARVTVSALGSGTGVGVGPRVRTGLGVGAAAARTGVDAAAGRCEACEDAAVTVASAILRRGVVSSASMPQPEGTTPSCQAQNAL